MNPTVIATITLQNGTTATLSADQAGVGFGYLLVTAPDGRAGTVQLQPQDNGDLVVRTHLDPSSPIHNLVVDGSGILFEQ